MRLGTDLEVLPVKVLCPAKPEVDDPCADGVIAEPIYEDEAPHIPVRGVGVKDHELIQRKVAHANLVKGERVRSQVFRGFNVKSVFGPCGHGIDSARTKFEHVSPSRQHWLLMHPDD